MDLNATETAQVRDLIAKQAEILSLATAEPTIISKLGATKKNISTVTPATVLADADLTFVRQGTQDKSSTISVLKSAMRDINIPTAFNSVLKPTAAPTPANPSQLLINNNNEIFMWVGIDWVLIGNGYSNSVSQAGSFTITDAAYTQTASVVMPRGGRVLIKGKQLLEKISGPPCWAAFYFYRNGVVSNRIALEGLADAGMSEYEGQGSDILDVSAGEVISIYVGVSASGSVVISGPTQNTLQFIYLT